ncbi:iron-containing alcohol dehydrogenase [Paraburkholderia kirstenboschensis]|uniref:iron-containing alcohol dehydrogenase n=1 Tax=Paraburkholderia kirstenboschensis TaxID=1245436 RepID=UPI003742D2E2
MSGLNAIAHAAEGRYAKDGNPVMSLMAEEGIRSLATGLRGLNKNSKDKAARSECLYGAWLCGMVLATFSGLMGTMQRSLLMAAARSLLERGGLSPALTSATDEEDALPHGRQKGSLAVPEAREEVNLAALHLSGIVIQKGITPSPSIRDATHYSGEIGFDIPCVIVTRADAFVIEQRKV